MKSNCNSAAFHCNRLAEALALRKMIDKEITIHSQDYWFKILDFLQQNWALIDGNSQGVSTIYFVHDGSGVFDRMIFPSLYEAQTGLKRNGFRLYADDSESQKFIAPPKPPFKESLHPNGLIYSSGRFWK